MSLETVRVASGHDTIWPVSKRRKSPRPELPEPRPPMSPAQIASAAYNLAVLQVHDDAAGDVAAGDSAAYEDDSALPGVPRHAGRPRPRLPYQAKCLPMRAIHAMTPFDQRVSRDAGDGSSRVSSRTRKS